MADALKKLDIEVSNQGGQLYITDLFRTWFEQEGTYAQKPKLAAKPGTSFHQAARAADIDVDNLNFKGVEKNKWLQKFWDICLPLGFVKIIDRPILGTAECWHYQFLGKDWQDCYKNLHHSEVAKACILDIGQWNLAEDKEKIKKMFVQSQLLRKGFYFIGTIDGIFGQNTNKALKQLGLDNKSIDECVEELKK